MMGDSDTQSVFLMSGLLLNFVLVAVTAEKPRFRLEMDVGNGNSVFIAFLAVSGYSALILIQNVGRFEVDSKILLRPPRCSMHHAYTRVADHSIASLCVSFLLILATKMILFGITWAKQTDVLKRGSGFSK